MKTYYPSNHEVAEHQRDRRNVLEGECKFADYENPESPPIDIRMVVREKGYAAKPQLLDEQGRFLMHIKHHWRDGVRAIYRDLGFHHDKGNKILQELVAAKLVTKETLQVNPNRRGPPRKVPRLTPLGERFRKAYENEQNNP